MYNIKNFFRKNGSAILTGLSIIGTIGSAITYTTATIKAKDMLDSEYKKKNKVPTKKEVIKLLAPIYILPLSFTAATLGCVIGSGVLNKHVQASMASAYVALGETYRAYRNKVKELYGKETDDKIINEIILEKTDDAQIICQDPLNGQDVSTMIYAEDEPEVLFFDKFSGRYFEMKPSKVINAIYYLNRNFVLMAYADVNMFYDMLGIDIIPDGEHYVWSFDDGYAWIDFTIDERTVSDDGLRANVISFAIMPCDKRL